jgi:hypothetical protein
MVVNDNAGNLTPSDVLEFIASMLAPTVVFHLSSSQVLVRDVECEVPKG